LKIVIVFELVDNEDFQSIFEVFLIFKAGITDRIEMAIYGSLSKLILLLKCTNKHIWWSIPVKDGPRNPVV